MDLFDLGLRRWSWHETARQDLVRLGVGRVSWDHGPVRDLEILRNGGCNHTSSWVTIVFVPGTCSMAGPGWISPASGRFTHHRHQWASPMMSGRRESVVNGNVDSNDVYCSDSVRELMKSGVTPYDEKGTPWGLRDTKTAIEQYSLGRSHGKCVYCGVQIARYDKSAGRWLCIEDRGYADDHLYPACKASPYMVGSIVCSCEGCNSKKGNDNWATFLSCVHAMCDEPDHLYPACKASPYMVGSIVCSCEGCNSKKGNDNWATFLSCVHAMCDEPLFKSLNTHVKWLKTNFIDVFVHRVPDQILEIMMKDEPGVTKEECHTIMELDRNPSLMTYTPALQEELYLRSIEDQEDVREEFVKQALPLYEAEFNRISRSMGKSASDTYLPTFTLFKWMISMEDKWCGENGGNGLSPEMAIIDHHDDQDPRMALASAVHDFTRPVMLDLQAKVKEETDRHQERKEQAGGRKVTNNTTKTYKRHVRSWNLLMRCWLQGMYDRLSDGKGVDPQKDQALRALAENSILPPDPTSLNVMADLPPYVDPISRMTLLATTVLDDRSGDGDLTVVPNGGKTIRLDLHSWLPNGFDKVKDGYEEGRKAVGHSSKRYKTVGWTGLKNDVFARVLEGGGDITDENGDLELEPIKTALVEKLMDEVFVRQPDGSLRLPTSKNEHPKARHIMTSISILSKILFREDLPREMDEVFVRQPDGSLRLPTSKNEHPKARHIMTSISILSKILFREDLPRELMDASRPVSTAVRSVPADLPAPATTRPWRFDERLRPESEWSEEDAVDEADGRVDSISEELEILRSRYRSEVRDARRAFAVTKINEIRGLRGVDDRVRLDLMAELVMEMVDTPGAEILM